MSEVFELLASDLAVRDSAPMLSPGINFPGAAVVAKKSPRFGKARRWSSPLCEQDLHCLLQILERDLIPQLLNSYSPARHATARLALAAE